LTSSSDRAGENADLLFGEGKTRRLCG